MSTSLITFRADEALQARAQAVGHVLCDGVPRDASAMHRAAYELGVRTAEAMAAGRASQPREREELPVVQAEVLRGLIRTVVQAELQGLSAAGLRQHGHLVGKVDEVLGILLRVREGEAGPKRR